MKATEAFKKLEKVGIDRQADIFAMRKKTEKQAKELEELRNSYEAVRYDSSVDALEVARIAVEIDRAEKALKDTNLAANELEVFGSYPELDQFRPLYDAGMADIMDQTKKVDFNRTIEQLTALTEQVKKINRQLTEYHNEVIKQTGSGAVELSGVGIRYPLPADEIAQLEACIQTLKQANDLFTVRCEMNNSDSVCEDWSGWAMVRSEPEEADSVQMSKTYSADFVAGQTVRVQAGNSLRGIANEPTKLVFNDSGLSAWIPERYIYGGRLTLNGTY